MTKPKHAENGTLLLPTKPDATVATGRLAARFWKKTNGQFEYDFEVFRNDQTDGEASHHFQSADLVDLVRLVQLLADEISQDESLGSKTCDDLASLAMSLEGARFTGYAFPDVRCLEDTPVGRSLASLVLHVWELEGYDFWEKPRRAHIYRVLVALDTWLRGVGPARWFELPQIDPSDVGDPFGGCPICAGNDGYRNLHMEHWFVCREHQVRWCLGKDLFDTWRSEHPSDWDDNYKEIGGFRPVYPMLNPALEDDNI